MNKSLFIHLSDIHLISNTPISKITELIVKSVKDNYDSLVDKVFLLFTGDMTQTAKKEEFKVFETLINGVASKLENSINLKPTCIILPGNHDIKLDGRQVPTNLDKCESQDKEKLLDGEIQYMEDAIQLCKKHGTFMENSFVSVVEKKYENIKYRFIVINSAPFSSKTYNDKEKHFISERFLDFPVSYEFGKKTITLFLMHHRPDWFDYKTMGVINAYLSANVSIAFFGHEHKPNYKLITTKNGSVFFDEGGELIANSSINNPVGGSFSISYLDEKTFLVKRHVYKIDYKSNTFIMDDTKQYSVRTKEILPLREEFLKDFYKSPLQSNEGNLLDLFVMPSITNGKDNFEVSNIEKMIEKIKLHRLFVIEGSSKSGKTTLLKAVFNECQKSCPCIFVTINSPTNDNIKKIIKDSFENMYGENRELFNQFLSFPLEKRFIFIDNFEVIKNANIKKDFLYYLEANFGGVVISYEKNEAPKDSIKEKSIFREDCIYKNYGITAKGRRELVQKVCEIKGVDVDNLDAVFNLFEREINGVNVLDFTDPSEGLLLLEAIIDQKLYLERNTNKAFTDTFSHYLESLLINAGSIENLESYKTILSMLAFNIWKKNKDITFSEEEMFESYSICNSEGRSHIKFKEFESVVLNSGVIYEFGNSKYRFNRNSYLSYFVSQEIIRLSNQGEDEHLQHLLGNVYSGLNSDIILFILFYTKNITPIYKISNKLDAAYSDSVKLNFNDSKNLLFSEETFLPEEAKDNQVTKADRLERRDKEEKAQSQQICEKEMNDISGGQFDEERKTIIETIKMVEIVAKAISGFESLIDKNKRKTLFFSAYNAIMRMISKLFSFSNEDIVELEEEYDEFKKTKLEELSQEKNPRIKEIESIKNSTIKSFLFGFLIETLTLYESAFAYLVTSKQTLKIIDELDNSSFDECVFKLYAYIFANKYEKFIEVLNFAKNNYHQNKINNLVSFFARIYIVHNSFTSEQFDRICSVAKIKKEALLPYASREEKIKK